MRAIDEPMRYPLRLWNDCAIGEEMTQAVAVGCRGGTTNPPLILKAAQADDHWAGRARELGAEYSPAEAARLLADEIRIVAARKLLPVFNETEGREGRLCVQVDPRNSGDVRAMISEAEQLWKLAPNLYIKVPLTATGLEVMRHLLDRKIWVTATVSFTVSQVLAVTSMYADFLRGWNIGSPPGLAAVLMVGRIDDYLRVLNEQRGLGVPEAIITQAGTAVAKRAYRLLRERGLPGLLLLAAPRGLYHITEFLEMDAVMTAGPAVRELAYDSASALSPGSAPSEEAVQTLCEAFPEFVQAYEPEALSVRDFASYGATVRTLDEFVAAQNGLDDFVRMCVDSRAASQERR